MADVFISYKSDEYEHANRIRSALQYNRISCWMAPESIGIGSDYASEIPNAISECRVFVLLLSPGAQESEWVPKELDKAISCKRIIMPFMIEKCELNNRFGFCLSNIQMIDGYTRNRDAAVQELVERIRFVLNPNPKVQPKPPVPTPEPPVQPPKPPVPTPIPPKQPPKPPVPTPVPPVQPPKPPVPTPVPPKQQPKPPIQHPKPPVQPPRGTVQPPKPPVPTPKPVGDDCKFAKPYSLKHPFPATVLLIFASILLPALENIASEFVLSVLGSVWFGSLIYIWLIFSVYKSKVKGKKSKEEVLKAKEDAQKAALFTSVASIILGVIGLILLNV